MQKPDVNKIGMFGLLTAIAVATTGVATMSSFIVSADAQPAGTGYCPQTVGEGKPSGNLCKSLTKENCEAVADLVPGRQVCVPNPPHGR